MSFRFSDWKVITDSELNYSAEPYSDTESITGSDTSVTADERDFLTWMSVLPYEEIDNDSSTFMERYVSMTEEDGVTPLHKACARGDLDQVELLCPTSNINSLDKYEYRPIHVTCIFGHVGVVEYLDEQGCDMKTPGNCGILPLHLAAKHGRIDVVEYLCKKKYGVDVPLNFCWTPIHIACRFGHTDIVRHLCEQSCSKEVLTDCEEQPLHIACRFGHLEIVRYLYEQRCDIEASTKVIHSLSIIISRDTTVARTRCISITSVSGFLSVAG